LTTILLVCNFSVKGHNGLCDQERQLIPLVIMTSQGLSSGDVNRDAQPLRFMIHEGVPVVLVQSFDTVSTLSPNLADYS
jgi:hypothetical protein